MQNRIGSDAQSIRPVFGTQMSYSSEFIVQIKPEAQKLRPAIPINGRCLSASLSGIDMLTYLHIKNLRIDHSVSTGKYCRASLSSQSRDLLR